MYGEKEMVRLPVPAGLDMSLGEAMFSQRAIRRFDHDREIVDADIKLMMDAASKAPSGGNTQRARFLVVKDRANIREFGSLYHEAWWAKRSEDFGWEPDQELPSDSPYRMNALLSREMCEAPVVVLVFAITGSTSNDDCAMAAQNLMLAARALGIGSVYTTLHDTVMKRVYELFEIPGSVDFRCCIPLGYPRGRFGPTSRLPTSLTTYWDGWGTPHPGDDQSQ
jgi:nitroreductase